MVGQEPPGRTGSASSCRSSMSTSNGWMAEVMSEGVWPAQAAAWRAATPLLRGVSPRDRQGQREESRQLVALRPLRLDRRRTPDALEDQALVTPRDIRGTQVCQICGELGSFSGGGQWPWGRSGSASLSPLDHDHVTPREPGSYGEREFAELKKLLDEAPWRFCEACRSRIRRADRQEHGFWLCGSCTRDDLRPVAERRRKATPR